MTTFSRIEEKFLVQMEKWDRRFLDLAKQVSTWSKDPSTQVGAILVNDLKQVVGMGYNGFPRGVHDWQERYDDREIKYPMVVHAEVNAIIQAGHAGTGLDALCLPVLHAAADLCRLC
jgi:dCMP deaminase